MTALRWQGDSYGLTSHEPQLYSSRYGAWCWCLCGWSTGDVRYRSTFGAHLAFGEHLRLAAGDPRTPTPDGHATCPRCEQKARTA